MVIRTVWVLLGLRSSSAPVFSAQLTLRWGISKGSKTAETKLTSCAISHIWGDWEALGYVLCTGEHSSWAMPVRCCMTSVRCLPGRSAIQRDVISLWKASYWRQVMVGWFFLAYKVALYSALPKSGGACDASWGECRFRTESAETRMRFAFPCLLPACLLGDIETAR